MSELSVSNLVNVDINLAANPSQIQNIQTLLILTDTNEINVKEGYRTYTSLTGVAQDFISTSVTYKSAAAYFSQNPQPRTLMVAQWNEVANYFKLVGGKLATSDRLISKWTSITDGAFKITVDTGAEVSVNGLDFSAATNFNGIASIIQAGINADYGAGIANVTVVWNTVLKQFSITSGTNTVDSLISYLTTPDSGTDISERLKMRAASVGVKISEVVGGETLMEALARIDDAYGQLWYALFVPGVTSVQHINVAEYIEASLSKHVYCINSKAPTTIDIVDTTSIAYLIKELGYTRTIIQYSTRSDYAVISLIARILTTDYNANNSVITLMYKTEPGVVAESLTQTEMDNLLSKNCNVFVKYNNNTAIIQPGIMTNGEYIDTLIGVDWLALTVQNEIYNLLYSNPTKIPQTNDGNNIIKAGISGTLNAAVNNGLLAPGKWQQGGFGSLKQNDYLDSGYYIFVPDINTQSSADRAARKSVPFQIACKLAGAVNKVDVIINVNR